MPKPGCARFGVGKGSAGDKTKSTQSHHILASSTRPLHATNKLYVTKQAGGQCIAHGIWELGCACADTCQRYVNTRQMDQRAGLGFGWKLSCWLLCINHVSWIGQLH